MISTGSPASDWAYAFLAQLARCGIRDIVVSPGSRSQALSLAAYDISQVQDSPIDLHVIIDERSAGFFGLGLAIQSDRPVVLLCTSGSAGAHYLPALIEAKHSGLPLIVITADRPQELRGVGANQTTVQRGMFGPAVHATFEQAAPEGDVSDLDAARAVGEDLYQAAMMGAARGRSGPVHLNVAFREPLSAPRHRLGVSSLLTESVAGSLFIEKSNTTPVRTIEVKPEPGTLVIAGHGAGSAAEDLAVKLGCPLIAEVHSGSHFGPNLITHYRELLDRTPTSYPIRRVICVGRPTLSRQVQTLLARTDIEHVVWQCAEPAPANPSQTATVVDQVRVRDAELAGEVEDWTAFWVSASHEIAAAEAATHDPPAPLVELLESGQMAERAEFAKSEVRAFQHPLTRRQVAREVWAATWPHDQLLLGSSRMIREFDSTVPGKRVPVWSSRGVSGIDGTIATARGAALAAVRHGTTGVTRVVMGDLSFLHDAGSLLMDTSEREQSRIQLIVVSDGGGSLFDLLEVKGSADGDAFDRVLFAPAKADIAQLAGGYDWQYRCVLSTSDLVEALGDAIAPTVIECRVER